MQTKKGWVNPGDPIYLREGYCSKCGLCCRLSPMPFGWADSDPAFRQDVEEKWFNQVFDSSDGRTHYGENWNVGQEVTELVRVVNDKPTFAPCKYLENKLCNIHSNKPLMCSIFPVHPNHIEDYPLCTYTFRKITNEELQELRARGKVEHIWQKTWHLIEGG